MINIIKTDMHPPIYFISLKFFCEIFGYSVLASKIFSFIPFVLLMLAGCTIVRKEFGNSCSLLFMFAYSAIPLCFYFTTQQRSYQWCILFVTLCLIYAIKFLKNSKFIDIVLLTAAALLSAFNHIYALVAVAGIFAFVNIYCILYKRKSLLKIFISDITCIFVYFPWLLCLINQTKSAYGNYWLKSIELNSLIVSAIAFILFIIILSFKRFRTLPLILCICTILSVHITGLTLSILVRPFYIGRYSVVCAGIFAFMISLLICQFKIKGKSISAFILALATCINFTWSVCFEYNSSLNNFIERFSNMHSISDELIYSDSAFGIMSFYLPEAKHYYTSKQQWYDAFINASYRSPDDTIKMKNTNKTIWYIKDKLNKTPKWISNNFKLIYADKFTSDFNEFYVYVLK